MSYGVVSNGSCWSVSVLVFLVLVCASDIVIGAADFVVIDRSSTSGVGAVVVSCDFVANGVVGPCFARADCVSSDSVVVTDGVANDGVVGVVDAADLRGVTNLSYIAGIASDGEGVAGTDVAVDCAADFSGYWCCQ